MLERDPCTQNPAETQRSWTLYQTESSGHGGIWGEGYWFENSILGIINMDSTWGGNDGLWLVRAGVLIHA